MNVDRHRVDDRGHAASLQELLQLVAQSRELVAMHPGMLVRLVEAGAVLPGLAPDPGAMEVRRAIVVGGQAAVALFAVASAGGDSVHVRIGPNPIRVPVVDLKHEASAERWLDGFHLACVARDAQTLRKLAQVSPASMTVEPGHEWRRRWVEALQAWGRQDPAWADSLRLAREAAASAPPQGRARAEALEMPLMEVAEAVVQGDPERIAQALARALEAHRDWYDRDERRADPAGVVAIGPLAYAALARARGLVLPLRSPYLPAALLEGWGDAEIPPGNRPTDPERARIAEQVLPLLLRFRGADSAAVVRSLEPRPGDYERVFVGPAAAAAREGYRELWARAPSPRVDRERTAIDVFVARTDDFTTGTSDAREFPGGYHQVLSAMQPGTTWVAWRYRSPTERGGMLFDGLVWLDDHWAWFPKPWRVVARTDSAG